MIYKIGLVEDSSAEASEIMLSLLENAPTELDEDSFILYDLKQEAGFKEHLFEEIKKDIEENNIQCLIVDYKLDTLYEIVEGIDIVNHFHSIVPEFPIIILTNVPDKGKENDYADPDKVYSKKDFLNPDSDATKAMVYNIIRNVQRYAKTRASLELERDDALTAIVESGSYSDDYYEKLIVAERRLSKYSPIELSAVDEAFDVVDMNEAIEALKEFKGLLE